MHESWKTAGFGDIYPEFMKHIGAKVRIWLSKFNSDIIDRNKFSRYFKKTKLLAILKLGKPINEVQNYQSITLFSVFISSLNVLSIIVTRT